MKKIGIIFGGMSTEHEVSKMSAKCILNNLDSEKYDIYQIYIDKNGVWYEYKNMEKIENIVQYIKKLDVVFPVLHGLYGEDGTIQGMLELLNIPYVGCKVLSSSVCMDKVYTKVIFEKAKINQANYVYIKKYKNNERFIYIDELFNEKEMKIDEILNIINKKIEFPAFIKPSNSGSSVGVNKAKNNDELKKYIFEAAKYDNKILIEQGIIGKELECAVLGNSEIGVEASRVGEIMSADEFYSYDAKYNNENSQTRIPANITKEQEEKIREIAIKAFLAVDGNGLSRVDFLLDDKTGEIYINEINTIPGFTNISMYPKLMEDYGYSYSKLLDKLIEIA